MLENCGLRTGLDPTGYFSFWSCLASFPCLHLSGALPGAQWYECPHSHVWQFVADSQLCLSLILEGTDSDFFTWPSQGCKKMRAEDAGPEATWWQFCYFFRLKQISRPARIQGIGYISTPDGRGSHIGLITLEVIQIYNHYAYMLRKFYNT